MRRWTGGQVSVGEPDARRAWRAISVNIYLVGVACSWPSAGRAQLSSARTDARPLIQVKSCPGKSIRQIHCIQRGALLGRLEFPRAELFKLSQAR